MKRNTVLVVILAVILIITGCSSPEKVHDDSSSSAISSASSSSSVSNLVPNQMDEFTLQEMSQAKALGIIPVGMSTEENITAKEFVALLQNTIKKAGGNDSKLTGNLAPNYADQKQISRADAALGFYLAAQAMGIDTHYANLAGLDQVDSYDGADVNLFRSLDDDYYVTDDNQKTPTNALTCAGWFVTSQGSLISNRPIMTSNKDVSFEIAGTFTRQDAILGAWRLYTSLAPKPDYVTPEEAKKLTYDPSAIPDTLLSAESSLPDISYTNIPQYNAMCYLAKESAYQRVGNGWFDEDSVRSLAKAGINFASVRYDFSVLNYPDYKSGKVNVNELKELDRLIGWGIKYGVHICIEGNGLPNQGGYPRGLHKYDMDTQNDVLQRLESGDKKLQQSFQSYWEILAARYAKIPAKYLSFNLCCEISSPDQNTYVSTFLPIAKAIRTYNNDRVIFSYANVGKTIDGLSAYGYPMAWSDFYPDMYAQISATDNHPLYDYKWKNWYLNGTIGYDAEGPRKVDIKLGTGITSATFSLLGADSDVWGPTNLAASKFSISADEAVLKRGTLNSSDKWQAYTVPVPANAKTLTLTSENGPGYLTFDGITLTKSDGSTIKISPTTYDNPTKNIPSATVDIASNGEVTTDVPMTFDFLLKQNELSDYLAVAKKNHVGIIVAEWGPVQSARTDADALDYFKLYADGFRKLGITAAPSRTPGFSFSTLVQKADLPGDFIKNAKRYVSAGEGSSYYIDTEEVQALTGKPYK